MSESVKLVKGKSVTIKPFYEIARGSVIEIDAVVGIAYKLSYVKLEQLEHPGDNIIKTFKLLSGMIGG